MDFSAEVRMGHSALLNIANVLVLATPAHGVYPAHLGLGKKRCRVTCVTTVLAACRQCAAQMRRSPTPWLSEDTAPNRTAAPAIGIPILRLNQLQPGGCTQLHHLNEAMPFRTAGWSSSSWSHRRAPIYLRRSHMPLYTAHRRLSLRRQHSVAWRVPSRDTPPQPFSPFQFP